MPCYEALVRSLAYSVLFGIARQLMLYSDTPNEMECLHCKKSEVKLTVQTICSLIVYNWQRDYDHKHEQNQETQP